MVPSPVVSTVAVNPPPEVAMRREIGDGRGGGNGPVHAEGLRTAVSGFIVETFGHPCAERAGADPDERDVEAADGADGGGVGGH